MLFAGCIPSNYGQSSTPAISSQKQAASAGTADTAKPGPGASAEIEAKVRQSEASFETAEEMDALQYGLVGDGRTDNTQAFRRLLAGGNRTIRVPAGDYVTGSLNIDARTVLVLAAGVTIRDSGQLKPTERLLSIRSASNVRIVGPGARIIANRADYTTGEQRHGVLIFGSRHVEIDGLESSGHGGDGFYIGGPPNHPSTDVVLKNCRAGDNRRQGLSITSARRVRIVDCEFTDTKGTAPQFGVDLEPNAPVDVLDDIALLRVRTRANAGGGILIYLKALNATSEPVNIAIVDHYSSLERQPVYTNIPANLVRTIRYNRAN